MKVLQINCVYKKGSTGKITYDIHSALLKEGMESLVYYGRGDEASEQNVRKVCSEVYAKVNNLWSRITGVRYGGCLFSTRKLIKNIKKENPDIVHLQCINGHFVNIYKLVKWLNDHKIRTILTLHAEFMYTANCSHAYGCNQWINGCEKCPRVKDATKTILLDRTNKSYLKMKDAFRDFENLKVISVSAWVKERAEKSLILKDKDHKVIYNGVDTNVFCRKNTDKIERKKIIFHVTPLFTDQKGHNKGGEYIIKLADRMKEENVQFVVAGKHNISGDIPSNIRLLGEIKEQNKLAEYYASADVTLLTSKRETFSMVCAESLCCGTPVVGFKAGAPETIAMREYSEFVEYGNVEQLEESLLNILYEKKYDRNIISVQASKVYSKDSMIKQYLQEYRRLL